MNGIPITITHRAVFIPHSGKAKQPLTQMNTFAELLSEGLSVRQAANRMGYGYEYGNAMLQRIRRKLGSQAI